MSLYMDEQESRLQRQLTTWESKHLVKLRQVSILILTELNILNCSLVNKSKIEKIHKTSLSSGMCNYKQI